VLPHVPMAVEYLAARGVPLDVVKAHRLGWLPDDYPTPESAGPEFHKWQRGALRSRIIFPVTDPLGRVMGLQTRGIVDRPGEKLRYLTYYAASRDIYAPTFGMVQSMPALFETGHCVLVEGPFDYFAVKAAGARAVFAQLTAGQSQGLMKFLRRYAQRVTALLDMDDAGRRGVQRLTMQLPELMVTAPDYPAHDPADFWKMPAGKIILPRMVSNDSLAGQLRNLGL